jgi:HAD superfamily hydrolase (TIGR01490 family)
MPPHNNSVVIFDIDETLIKGQSQKLFVDYLFKKRLISLGVYLKILLWFILYKLHIVKNPRAIIDYGFRFSRGMTVVAMENLVDHFFKEALVDKFYPQSLDIIKKHQASGDIIVLVSNAFDFLVRRIANHLSIQYFICTKLALSSNILTGTIEGEIVYGQKKVELIKQFLQDHTFSLLGSWAYADHISDLDVLRLVDNPVVVNPDAHLLKEAKKRRWKILSYK